MMHMGGFEIGELQVGREICGLPASSPRVVTEWVVSANTAAEKGEVLAICAAEKGEPLVG
jgi:hypothetical protein